MKPADKSVFPNLLRVVTPITVAKQPNGKDNK